MAAPTLPLTPVDEYLNTTYRPDREYVPGLLVERNAGTPAHSLLQALLVLHFGQLRKQYGYAVLTEARTLIVPRGQISDSRRDARGLTRAEKIKW